MTILRMQVSYAVKQLAMSSSLAGGLIVYVLPNYSIECSEENMFPCSEAPLNDSLCVSELQFCDGDRDCPEGSDEPEECR